MKSTCFGPPLPPMSKEWHDSLKIMTPSKPKRHRTFTDKQRLDWMDNSLISVEGTFKKWIVSGIDSIGTGLTVRQAIDAAMRSEKGRK